jgi:hypothetical protein
MLSTKQVSSLLGWPVVFSLLVALICAGEARAAAFAITGATWDAQGQNLTVEGAGTTRRVVTVFNADNDSRLGRAWVADNETWIVIVNNPSPVPCRVSASQASGGSAGPVDVSGAPAACNPPVNTPPVCSIDTPSGDVSIFAGEAVNYAGTITDTDGNLDSISWSFPGGTPDGSADPSPGDVTYSNTGVFITTLDATDTDGAACVQQTRTITVEAPPPVNTPPVCSIDTPSGDVSIFAGETVNYAATITDADGNLDSISWSFPGGTPDSSADPSPGDVTYSNTGVFITTLDAMDTEGAACVQQTRTITVGQQPGTVPGPVGQVSNAGLLGTDYPGHVVLAANDLGMHCADQDDSIFSVLPPLNVLHAQVIQRGTSSSAPPMVLDDSQVRVVYSAASNPDDPVGPDSINSTSANFPGAGGGPPLVYKGNFWDPDPVTGNPIGFDGYAPLFFGLLTPAAVLQDLGLPVPETILLRSCLPPPFATGSGDCAFAQQAMPGIGNPYHENVPQDTHFDQDFGFFNDLLGGLNGVDGKPLGGIITGVNWFRADGIPMLPVDDQGRVNAYPLVRVQALQGSIPVASTDVVLPVAAEADCQLCHADPVDCADPGLPPQIQTDQCNGLAYTPTGISATVFTGETISGAPGDTTEQKLLNAAKINILRLHDAKHGTTLDATRKVVCSSCHYSPATDLAQVGPTDTPDGTAGSGLPGTEQSQHISMSRAMHGHHGSLVFNGNKVFPDMPPPVDSLGGPRNPVTSADILQETCYQCHPGKRTRCLRGAMGGAGIVCQDCHGSMTQVGNDFTGNFPVDGSADLGKRVPWASEPKCQSCHTGDAASTNHPGGAIVAPDGIRLLQAYTESEHAGQGGSATPIVSPSSRFGENESLYRLSGNDDGSGKGHGGLMCEGCHGSTHAIFPNANDSANDNVAAKQLQGHTGSIVQCTTCHQNDLGLTRNGPHGMHPVAPVSMNNGQIDTSVAFTSWSRNHKDVNDSGCRSCHGNNGQGTVLSRTAADRTLPCKEDNKCDGRINEENVIFVPAGTEVSCTLCHDNKIQ